MAPSTTANETLSKQARQKASRDWWRKIRFPAVLVSLLGIVIVSIIYFQVSLVVGRELNSKTWQVREFRFHRDPFTNYQLTGIRYTFSKQLAPAKLGQTTTGLNNTAASDDAKLDPSIESLFNLQDSIKERWDLVELRGISTGRAAILLDLIDAKTPDFSNFWIIWTRDHPKKAATLWPAVHDLVSIGCYSRLPKLMETALHAKDSSQLKSLIQTVLQVEMLAAAKSSKNSGDIDSAKAIASVGLQYGSNVDLESFLSEIDES
jgi:hypothetical protein